MDGIGISWAPIRANINTKFYMIKHLCIDEEQLLLGESEDVLAGVDLHAGVPRPAALSAAPGPATLAIIRGGRGGDLRKGRGPAFLDMVISDGL